MTDEVIIDPPESAKNVDWSALFLKYVLSSVQDARTFIKLVLGPNIVESGWVQQRIKGWRKEKQTALKEARDEALKSNLVVNATEELIEAKLRYLGEMKRRIQIMPELMNEKELNANLAAIKTELGEPARITKQEIKNIDPHDDETIDKLMTRAKNTTTNSTEKGGNASKRKPKASRSPSKDK